LDEILIIGRDDDRDLFQQLAAQYGPPAYVRRAQQVHEAFQHVLDRCGRQREEWLAMVRLRLGALKLLAGDWAILRPLLADDSQLELLRWLWAALEPRPRLPTELTRARGKLRRALRELVESLERFNRRWLEFLRGVDLTFVNELRDGYNRYYLLEKECALRSPRLARHGFARLEPLTVAVLASLLPPLPVPRLSDTSPGR
jgi:hypothetical protein